MKKENEQLQVQFLKHGKELISQRVCSLADEMEDATKDDVSLIIKIIIIIILALHTYSMNMPKLLLTLTPTMLCISPVFKLYNIELKGGCGLRMNFDPVSR